MKMEVLDQLIKQTNTKAVNYEDSSIAKLT
jgi:hypothetical protein